MRVALVLYTTLYREGGPAFRRAARTLARELRARLSHDVVVIERAVESKAAFVDAVTRPGGDVVELHFIGHSGMYGIMFGTTAWPEQMSPHEWRSLRIPFAAGAHAYFHACRTARWLTPFFARTFRVEASGYWWYTTISRKKRRFSLDDGKSRDAYIVSVHGRKSGGLAATAHKHIGNPRLLPLVTAHPPPREDDVDTSYDAVAALYDDTFADARVRGDELAYLRRKLAALPRKPRVLDIGCGTGAFLRATRDLCAGATGVDVSARMIDRARARSANDERLRFEVIAGPSLPFADASFDVVTSMLSFRYLDWDPMVCEILRVLRPGGRLIVVDMVAAPLRASQVPRLFFDKARKLAGEALRPSYKRALQRMVQDPAWARMLAYNPMRAEHELRWYLDSRFPGGEMRVINVGRRAQILAFCSAPLVARQVSPLSYP